MTTLDFANVSLHYWYLLAVQTYKRNSWQSI